MMIIITVWIPGSSTIQNWSSVLNNVKDATNDKQITRTKVKTMTGNKVKTMIGKPFNLILMVKIMVRELIQ
jgi:hypothetical protein